MAATCKPLFKRCCIIGLGLMGGSLGMALGQYGVVKERRGFDLDPRVRKPALARGAIDRWAAPPACLSQAELVIIALPVGSIRQCLKNIAPYVQPGTLVTDLGSTKKGVVRAMTDCLPGRVWGVGGHPMAGSEKSGIVAANPDLFKDAVYVLTPTADTPWPAITRLKRMIRVIGARPIILGAQEHDRLAALISHLPHLVAVALCSMLTRYNAEKNLLLTLAGRGFKDSTRIAMGDTDLWHDTFASNKLFLKESLKAFEKELNMLYNSLEQGEARQSKQMLGRAAGFRWLFDKRVDR